MTTYPQHHPSDPRNQHETLFAPGGISLTCIRFAKQVVRVSVYSVSSLTSVYILVSSPDINHGLGISLR